MVTALGIRAGYASTCVSNNYIYEFPVTAWPPSGTYNNALSLSLSNSQALAIYYQVSGGGWQTYTGPFSLDGTGSGNVGLSTRYDTATPCPGPTNLCSYSFKAADPLITPTGTNFNGSLTLSAADGTAGRGDLLRDWRHEREPGLCLGHHEPLHRADHRRFNAPVHLPGP